MNTMKSLLILSLTLGLTATAGAQLKGASHGWTQENLDLAASLAVQDGGRIKPFDTFAQFTMLKLNGKRIHRTKNGEKIEPVEWMLDCLFYPEDAKNYQHFLVNDSDVITAIGAEAHEKKRGHYSYNEIQAARAKLMQLATKYGGIESNQRSPLEQEVINLAHNVFQFEQIATALDLARRSFHVHGETSLAKALPDEGEHAVSASTALAVLPGVVAAFREEADSLAPEKLEEEVAAIQNLLGEIQQASASGRVLAFVPPSDPEAKEWLSLADVFPSSHSFEAADPFLLSALGHLEKMAALSTPGEFTNALKALHGEIKAAAETRGEYKKIPIEVAFYKGKFLFYSQWLYVLSFIFAAFTWLLPQNKKLAAATFLAVAAPTILLVIGIILRCIIRGRPPVSTLYETILFITAIAVIIALAAEVFNRRRIALAMASFLGMFGMFLAFRYEAKEGIDTMPSLVAVLDTNFWLATHVTSITMGYAAGLLGGALAHIYIFAKLFNLKKDDKSFYKTTARMVYGILCFGLLFSVVGTILGGIWANESWGRFWGWDPKENGALLICLWGLVILHARMGGYIRDLGVSICSVVMGMIVAFSWWGVNLLGVGLHAYGFISGIMGWLMIFWGCESLVIAAGLYVALRQRLERQTPPHAPGSQTA